jgi:putative tricarboxylic transport membrane protein
MNRSDLWAGLVLVGLGLAITLQALRLDYIDEYGPGPGFFPVWIGVGLLVLASLLVILSVIRRTTPHPKEPTSWTETARAIGIWIGFMSAIALLKPLGFLVTFVLLAVFLVFIVSRRSLWTALMVGLGGALGFYVLFVVALGVPVPVGPWGF